MAGNENYLRPILNAGSSRVFNCNDRFRALVRDGAADPSFFQVGAMHSLVLIKEAMPRELYATTGKIVGTKLYFPYNCDDIYEGGRSIFYASPRLLEVLREQFGLGGATIPSEDIAHDLQILQILDELPSLDGFLMSDGLRNEGIAANQLYFEVPDDERDAIQAHITNKLRPLVQAAFGSNESMSGEVSNLVSKIWEAKDKVGLGPLIKACRFPDDEALAIFAAWKGILFYSYEYERTAAKRVELALWLRDHAVPNKFATLRDTEHIRLLRRKAIQQFREHWSSVDDIVRAYERLYAKFLTTADGVAGFMEFLRGARHIYWRLGDSLSKLDHAVNCWTISLAAMPDKSLPPDKLVSLFDILNLILVHKDGPAVPDEKRAAAEGGQGGCNVLVPNGGIKPGMQRRIAP